MNSTTTQPNFRFRALLTQREGELRAILASEGAAASVAVHAQSEVKDFKDIAASDSASAIDAIQGEHAVTELAQVVAALWRLDQGSYGRCLECGETIDERRLAALPATPLCTACQTDAERTQGGRRGHDSHNHQGQS